MKNKIWKEVSFVNHVEQKIIIQPTPEFGGITLSFGELEDDKSDSGLLYIIKEELPFIIEELQKMMEYIVK